MAKAPLISVVMPVFNARQFVVHAIDSVLLQTQGNFELIAVDDGSTDGSSGILNHLAKCDPRIRVIRQANAGVTEALNHGIRQARGTFVARMDADDLSEHHRFSEQVKFLDQNPDVVAVGSWAQVIDPLGAPLKRLTPPTDHHAIDQGFLEGHGGMIPHPSAMIRRSALEQVGPYRYDHVEDIDLFLRLAEVGKLANLPLVLLNYREHMGNACFVKQRQQWDNLLKVVEEARTRRGLDPRGSQVFQRNFTPTSTLTPWDRYRSWTLHAIESGHYEVARKHAWSLVRSRPWQLQSWRVLRWAWSSRGPVESSQGRAA